MALHGHEWPQDEKVPSPLVVLPGLGLDSGPQMLCQDGFVNEYADELITFDVILYLRTCSVCLFLLNHVKCY